MKKLIQILIVCVLVAMMGGSASGDETMLKKMLKEHCSVSSDPESCAQREDLIKKFRPMATERKALCSKKFPKEKNMITVKGFYIGMNICDAEKLIKEGKYKSVFGNNAVFIRNILSANNEGKVTKIYFKGNLLHDLFKSKDMSLIMFSETFAKHYIKGKFMFQMEPHNDIANKNFGYKYYNGEVGYKFFIKQNESGTGAESLTIEEVAKVSEGFGD